MNSLIENDKEALWNRVCDGLRVHCKPIHTSIDTLNRLFHEQLSKLPHNTNFPFLNPMNSFVSEEKWTTEEIAMRLDPTMRHKRKSPKDESGPIIVVNDNGDFFIIDGSNRVNKWLEDNVNRDCSVLVIRNKSRNQKCVVKIRSGSSRVSKSCL